MSIREINFDGIVGPSHNYAGLSFGNLASTKNAGHVSQPRAAALQGIEKMRSNLRLGLTQGIFLPHPRPNRAWLAELASDIDHAEAAKSMFEKLVANWPQVRECYMLAGETDFLLRIVASDWDSYNKFLTSKLTSAPNVSHVKSALAIRASKRDVGVPIDEEALVHEMD